MSRPSGISSRGRTELTAVLESNRRFVTPDDVSRVLDIDARSAAKKLARWAAEGWLRRAKRGLYIPVPLDASNPAAWSEDALVVAAAVWSPCYFTGWTAASHWGLTDQVFRTTVLKTEARVRKSEVRLLDHDYLLHHTPKALTEWGIRREWLGDVRLRFADPARTVIDILDTPRLGGGIRHSSEILAAYLEEGDPATLVNYGDLLGNRAVFKRLGYLLEAMDGDRPELVAECRARVSAGISKLDPGGSSSGRRVTRWGLLINASVGPEEPA